MGEYHVFPCANSQDTDQIAHVHAQSGLDLRHSLLHSKIAQCVCACAHGSVVLVEQIWKNIVCFFSAIAILPLLLVVKNIWHVFMLYM